MVRIFTVVSAFVLLSAIPAAAQAPAAQAPAAPQALDARAAFDKLKALAGEWDGFIDKNPEMKTAVSYKVTANGSALMETLFAGTPHEMVTMYHMDGDDLMLTHYCASGNQPRMKLSRERSKPPELFFDFAGGTNMKPEKDGHMHAAKFLFLEDGRLETEWTYYEGGEQKGSHAFSLKRR